MQINMSFCGFIVVCERSLATKCHLHDASCFSMSAHLVTACPNLSVNRNYPGGGWSVLLISAVSVEGHDIILKVFRRNQRNRRTNSTFPFPPLICASQKRKKKLNLWCVYCREPFNTTLRKYQHSWVTCLSTPPSSSFSPHHRWATDAWSAWHSPSAAPGAKGKAPLLECGLPGRNKLYSLPLQLHFPIQGFDPGNVCWWDLFSKFSQARYLMSWNLKLNASLIHSSDMFVSVDITEVHIMVQLQEVCIHIISIPLWPSWIRTLSVTRVRSSPRTDLSA